MSDGIRELFESSFNGQCHDCSKDFVTVRMIEIQPKVWAAVCARCRRKYDRRFGK
jgi:predicted SprT family Zn-dependent metalloprotease